MEVYIGNGSPVGKLRGRLYFCLAETWKLLADAVAELKHEHV